MAWGIEVSIGVYDGKSFHPLGLGVDSLRSDVAFSGSPPRIVHDNIFIFGENKKEINPAQPSLSPVLTASQPFNLGIAELWWVPWGGLEVREDLGAKGRWDKNGKMSGRDRFITMEVDLIPDGELVASHVVSSTCTRRGETARAQAWSTSSRRVPTLHGSHPMR